MPHTVGISPSTTVSFTSDAPGTSKVITLFVNNATQPENTVNASVSVEFAGETVTAPLTVEFNNLETPVTTIDLGGASNLSASIGTPLQAQPDQWQIPVTITVV